MEKKLRIQLFDEEGRLLDDRTVSQNPELSKGPPGTHYGMFRVEFTLMDKTDVEKVKTYLDQMIGTLPLGSKKTRKKTKMDSEDPSHREDLVKEVLEQVTDQDDLIIKLRDVGFKFMMSDFLESLDFEELNIKPNHLEKYQWMLYLRKPAKNPKSDKYDPMLVFGIQLLPEHNEKIVVYLNGEFYKSYKIKVLDKPKEVFKTTSMMKFPDYMTHDERDKFRYELRQYQNDPERQLSKFFIRWRKWVENVPLSLQDENDGEN